MVKLKILLNEVYENAKCNEHEKPMVKAFNSCERLMFLHSSFSNNSSLLFYYEPRENVVLRDFVYYGGHRYIFRDQNIERNSADIYLRY